MRIYYLFIVLFSMAVRSQNQPIEIVIDSIVSNKLILTERRFSVHYHLTNLSEKPVSFYLSTQDMIPIGAGSMNPRPYLKLYEGNNSVNVNTIFETHTPETIDTKSIIGPDGKDFSEMNETEITDFFMKQKSRMITENLVRMKPKEKKTFCSDLTWNMQRYHLNDDLEYYLSETETHYIELSIHLMKEHLQNQVSPEQYSCMFQDDTFIKGWFTSNKVMIDLRP